MMLLPLAAAGLSAYGAVKQGNSQAQAYYGEAASHDYNAKVADINTATAYAQGGAREEQVRRQDRQTMGAQRVGVAESGTGFGGSNAQVLRQGATEAELNALNVRYGAALEATGYKNEAQAERFNAKLSRKAGKDARKAGLLSGTGMLVSGLAGNYANSGNIWGI